MWIYTYLRADGEEIDMGGFETPEEAKKAQEKHASYGALTAGPFEKPANYKLYKGTPEPD